MNKLIMSVTLFAFSAFGATNDVKYSSLIYWTDSITYAPDVQLKVLRALREKENSGMDTSQESSASEHKISENTTAIGGKIETKADASASYRGLPMAKASVHAEAFAKTRFAWEQKRASKNQSMQKEWIRTVEEKSGETSIMKSDWKLRFNINFKNESKEQTFTYKEDEKYTGVFLVVQDKDDLKKDAQRISVLPDDLKPDCFELRPNGGKTTLTVEADIPNEDIREILLNANVLGVLDQYVTIEFDDKFRMEDKDTKSPWNYQDVCASRVAIMGFGTWPPEIVNSGGLTYRQVLETAKRLPFRYTEGDALDEVGRRPFGRFERDEKGVYVVLAKIHGVFKDRLSKEDLEQRISAKDNDKDLIFELLRLQEIYDNYNQYPASVVSNCFSYVQNSREISDKDLFACAMIARKIRDCALFGHCLTRMDIVKLGNILGDEENKSLAMSFIIESDNAEYFAKLCSLGWVCADRTMLGFAAEKGSTNIVSWLLEKAPKLERPEVDGLVANADEDAPGDIGKTPLFWAAKNGHLDVCRYLVSKGADVNRKFYDKENKSGKVRECDELVDDSYITNDLTRSYIKAQREVFDIKNYHWWESSRTAKPKGVTKEKIVEWVNAGVLPGSYNSYLGCHWNFLSWAVEMNDPSLVAFLVDKGADINGEYSSTPDEKHTALMLACELGDTNLVAKLILKGADLYAHQDNGMSAFNYAVKSRHYDCAEILLNKLEPAKCSEVEDDDMKLNFFEYVGKYCDDKEFSQKVKVKYGDAWLNMLVSLHGLGFRECLNKCDLNDAEAEKLLENYPSVQMADDLYDRSHLRGYLEKIKDERESREAHNPLWIECFKFIELREKAERDDAESLYELGMRYGLGVGVVKDLKKAFDNFSKAAKVGHSKACYNLSVCYSKGLGTQTDKDKALHWKQEAEKRGYSQK